MLERNQTRIPHWSIIDASVEYREVTFRVPLKGISWGVEYYEAGLLLLAKYESKTSLQCPDDGSLLTWFDHHGNSYWTHNLFQRRLCSDFWIKLTDLIFHLLFFLYKLIEPCTGLQQLHKCTVQPRAVITPANYLLCIKLRGILYIHWEWWRYSSYKCLCN